MFIRPELRGKDKHGSGAYGASRGKRKHVGIDFAVDPETPVASHVDGVVTKLGYPYGDDLSFRYVQVTDKNQNDHRFFYVEPSVGIGDPIEVGTFIGLSQKLGSRYKKITEHVHYEVKRGKEYLDPRDFV